MSSTVTSRLPGQNQSEPLPDSLAVQAESHPFREVFGVPRGSSTPTVNKYIVHRARYTPLPLVLPVWNIPNLPVKVFKGLHGFRRKQIRSQPRPSVTRPMVISVWESWANILCLASWRSGTSSILAVLRTIQYFPEHQDAFDADLRFKGGWDLTQIKTAGGPLQEFLFEPSILLGTHAAAA